MLIYLSTFLILFIISLDVEKESFTFSSIKFTPKIIILYSLFKANKYFYLKLTISICFNNFGNDVN